MNQPTPPPLVIAAFYHFTNLPDYTEMRLPLQQFCITHEVKGTILLAPEGINGTIAGPRPGIDAVFAHLRSDPRMATLEHKESFVDPAEEEPFYRMKVRLKREIVALGLPEVNPNEQVGTYVDPHEWNALISDPEVLVIDTRNDYEYVVGTFRGAINPETRAFREFPAYVRQNLDPKKYKKVAMFCTGGIRCEKATSFMLLEGFEEVYHLKGGILKYLEEVNPEESLWEGECFVFDNRVTVDHYLQPGNYAMCYACKRPLSDEDMESPDYEEGISCPYCVHNLTPEKRVGLAERQKQVKLAEIRQERHIGRLF